MRHFDRLVKAIVEKYNRLPKWARWILLFPLCAAFAGACALLLLPFGYDHWLVLGVVAIVGFCIALDTLEPKWEEIFSKALPSWAWWIVLPPLLCVLAWALFAAAFLWSHRVGIRQAASLRESLSKGMKWEKIAPALRADPEWDMLRFKGIVQAGPYKVGDGRCGMFIRSGEDYVYKFSSSEFGYGEETLLDLTDPILFSQAKTCSEVRVRYPWHIHPFIRPVVTLRLTEEGDVELICPKSDQFCRDR